MQYLARSQ